MRDALGSLALAALLVAGAVWVTIINYREDKADRRIPSFADCVDTAACIAVLIVVTNWLGIWDGGSRKASGSPGDVDVLLIPIALFKAVFLVFVPSIFLLNGMRRLGGLGRRAAIYGGFFALAIGVSVISR
jgi:hypothetical protein